MPYLIKLSLILCFCMTNELKYHVAGMALLVYHFGPDWSFSTINDFWLDWEETSTGIYCLLRINPTDFFDFELWLFTQWCHKDWYSWFQVKMSWQLILQIFYVPYWYLSLVSFMTCHQQFKIFQFSLFNKSAFTIWIGIILSLHIHASKVLFSSSSTIRLTYFWFFR